MSKIKKLRQTICCELCKKTFSERKKLSAHKKYCESKFNESNKRSFSSVENAENSTSKLLKKKPSLNKKQKLNDQSNFDSDLSSSVTQNDSLKNLDPDDSINLNFLFE